MFNATSGSGTAVSKPRKTTSIKVLSAVIRAEGCFASVQKMGKNLRPLSTKVIKGINISIIILYINIYF